MRARGVLVAAALALGALALASCDVNDYCVNCQNGDGGNGDGAVSDGGDGDGGGDVDSCVPDVESCNGLDDDCDGTVDEDVPQVGTACGTDVGECTAGVYQCTSGVLRCTGVGGSPEICDGLDNDCDGTPDDGNPGGGQICGTDFGECQAGITQCTGGSIQCIGAVGMPGQNPEVCDGRDNDCDNRFDEDIPPMGSCGQSNVGECRFGQLMCVGGTATCVGAVGPTLELCDNLDQDCDGNPTNGFDLQTDPRNCGTCNHVCTVPNAVAGCATGQCTVGFCLPGHYDLDGQVGNGCEYACQFQSAQEACNGVDDDCDGVVDEDLVVPDICDHDGACAGTVATCGPTGFTCRYPATVSTDASGNIVPETTCDGIDNDCNGRVDDSHPTKGQACGDSNMGVCRGTGTFVCNPANPTGPVVCNITTPGQTSSAEVCDNLDNDCNGVVDDNAAQDYVSIGGGRSIMRWEASHPDATATFGGSATAHACSKPGVLPWTNITYQQARDACMTIGADLCTEQDWHRACAVVSKTSYPVTEPSANNGLMFFEAEDYLSIATGTSGGVERAWTPAASPTPFSGISAMQASPNTGAAPSMANAPTQSPRLDFQVTFTQTGNHYVWVRIYGPSDADDDVYVGINATLPGTAQQAVDDNVNNGWTWRRSAAINITGTVPQTRYVSVWMQNDGVRLDTIAVTRSNSTTAPTFTAAGPGGTWSYASNNTTYQQGVCNEDAYDTDPNTAGDQDDLLVGGDRASCYANWGSTTNRVNDLSGNAKEWTLARQDGVNPIRGGASNNTGNGITCNLAFTVGDNQFFFPNVGFRCCK